MRNSSMLAALAAAISGPAGRLLEMPGAGGIAPTSPNGRPKRTTRQQQRAAAKLRNQRRHRRASH